MTKKIQNYLNATSFFQILSALLTSLMLVSGCSTQTPLMRAAKDGNIGGAEGLLKEGKDINERNGQDETALLYAAHEGQAGMVRFLLEHGAAIDAKAVNGITPLMEASALGHIDVVDILLHAGAKPNAQELRGLTALHFAAINGKSNAVRLLLMGGSDVNARAQGGVPPLIEAASAGQTEIVSMLLDQQADVDAKTQIGETALHYASGRGHKKVVQILLARGADPFARNHNGQTPSAIADISQQPEVAQLLRESERKATGVTTEKPDQLHPPPLASVNEGNTLGQLQGLYYYEMNVRGHETNSYLFMSNGRVFNGFPPGGVATFSELNLEPACQRFPQKCGTYDVTGHQIVFKWGGGKAPERFSLQSLTLKRPNDLLNIGGKKYYSVHGLGSSVLNGTYMWPNKMNTGTILYSSPYAEVTGDMNTATVIGSEHYVVFSPNGEFQEIHSGSLQSYGTTGALFGDNSKQDRGRYRISGHTLVFQYQNGQKKSFTFFITPQFSENPHVVEQFYLDGDDLALKR